MTGSRMPITPRLTRRDFLGISAAGLGAMAFGRGCRASVGPTARPNFLFILTDDQRFDALGCAGNPIIRTPNVDRLAGAGIRFDRAFVTTPICAASRASILTGMYERTHTYTFTKPPLARAFTDISFPVRFRQAGYRTGFVGKFGVAVAEGVREEMFDIARLGLDGNTVIIYTSDNGYFLGERGYADKWLMYEPSIRVPLVVFDPRAPRESRGLVKRDLVLNIDLGPTLMDLAGIAVPRQIQGRSLKPLLGRRTPAWRSEIFCEELWDHPDIPRSECVRTERWKYIQYPGHPEYVELFDLAVDPDEKRNLAGDPGHAHVLAELRERCSWMIKALRDDQTRFK